MAQEVAWGLKEDLRSELRARIAAQEDATLARRGLALPAGDAAAAAEPARLQQQVAELRRRLRQRSLLHDEWGASAAQLGAPLPVDTRRAARGGGGGVGSCEAAANEACAPEAPLVALMRRQVAALQQACSLRGLAGDSDAAAGAGALSACVHEVAQQVGH